MGCFRNCQNDLKVQYFKWSVLPLDVLRSSSESVFDCWPECSQHFGANSDNIGFEQGEPQPEIGFLHIDLDIKGVA